MADATITASRRLPRGAAFGAIAAVFVLFMAASGAPSPLYVVYQHRWGFSATTLTVIFAAYVAGLLGSLLVVGALSDHIGRRPVLAGAVALEAVSLVMFLTAGDVTALTAARIAQGVATGAAVTALGAALVDLDPPHARGRAGMLNSVAPVGGLAVGALGCGALVQYAPGPTHLIYAVLLGGMLFAALVVAFVPETSARRPGALSSLRPVSASRRGCAPMSSRSSPSWWPPGHWAACTSPSVRRWPRRCSVCTAISSVGWS